MANPAVVKIDKGKVLAWLEKGAIPSETVFNLLQKQGIALEWHLLKNKVSPQAADIELQKWAMMKNVPVTKIEPAGKATDEAEPQSAPEKEINLQNQANSDTGDTPSASSISE